MAAAHAREIKVILDFVPNHTSDQHPWFLESRASRNKPEARLVHLARRQAGRRHRPTTGCRNSADRPGRCEARTGQYYLHSFLREQPDLNWRNPDVRAAMYDVLRFWLDRGVDGFRVDVLWLLIKDAALPRQPAEPELSADRGRHPSLPAGLQRRPARDARGRSPRCAAFSTSYDERVLIGEIYLPIERLVDLLRQGSRAARICRSISSCIQTAWNARGDRKLVTDYEAALPPGGWPNWVLGNHDQPRIAARVGAAQARVAAMLLLTLRGTPTMYYGDELGIGSGDDPAEARAGPMGKERAGSRPRPRSLAHAVAVGCHVECRIFRRARPWLPLDPTYESHNVKALRADPASILGLYRDLLSIRRKHRCARQRRVPPARRRGQCASSSNARRMASESSSVSISATPSSRCRWKISAARSILASTHADRASLDPKTVLRPNEGLTILTAS